MTEIVRPPSLDVAYGPGTLAKVASTKVLVVGAGGVGCELLKNLATSGFVDVTVVDLDTIDVSNLNRQFLFRREHVSRSKAEIAAAQVSKLVPGVRIRGLVGNIKDDRFDVAWFAQFGIVCNALDNVEARRHVNKMCLAADVPMIESGSTGYNGQVAVVKSPQTECYDCTPKPAQKSYAVCTIRSTPEKPVHCIVWAKALFDLLFGPPDPSNVLADLHVVPAKPDEDRRKTAPEVRASDVGDRVNGTPEQIHINGDVANGRNSQEQNGPHSSKSKKLGEGDAPDTSYLIQSDQANKEANKPEGAESAAGDLVGSSEHGKTADMFAQMANGSKASRLRYLPTDTPQSFADRVSRVIFEDDIKYQRALDSLWSEERPPPSITTIRSSQIKLTDISDLDLHSQIPWSLETSCSVFLSSLLALAPSLAGTPKYVTFDKDNPTALALVVAAANIRAVAYHVPNGLVSPFKGKGIAGNIIEAVATTNAAVAGLVVLEALRIVAADFDVEKAGSMTTFVVRKPAGGGGATRRRSFIVSGEPVSRGRSNCFVCGGGTKGRGWRWKGDITKWRLDDFLDRIVCGNMGLLVPSVDNLGVGEGGGSLIYEGGDDLEEDEIEFYKENTQKTLEVLGIKKLGGALSLNDLKTSKQTTLYIQHDAEMGDDEHGKLRYEISGSWPAVVAAKEPTDEKSTNKIEPTNDNTKDGDSDIIDADELEIIEDDSRTHEGKKRTRDEMEDANVDDDKAEPSRKRTKAALL